jgi:hypothetical protein
MLTRLMLICALFASIAFAQSPQDPVVVFTQRTIANTKSYRPADGYVPDSKTAVAIATAVLTPIYGKSDIDSESPWHTGLKNSIWTVVGTFNGRGNGGEAIVQIDQETGAIRFVGHTR